MSIVQRTVRLDAGDGTRYHCYIAIPESGSGPGLILLPDAHGAGDHMKHQANLYAEEGWVVALPDLYARQGGAQELGFDALGNARAAELAAALEPERALADIAVACAALLGLPERVGALGIVGHGPGARLALRFAAREPAIVCAVACSPNAIDADGVPPCPTVIHIGGSDPTFAPPMPATLARVFAAQPQIALHIYPNAAANFEERNHHNYHRAAAGMARSRTLACLRAALGPTYDLATLWDAHLFSEFADRDVDVSMSTMVEEPYVLVVPTVTGGTGKRDLHRWYSDHFHYQNPVDTHIVPISRTVGTDRVVDEFVFCCTHDRVMDWLLPGIAPTGKTIEVPMIAVVNFRGSRLYHEHIWWDQASVLVQVGLLDPTGLPVTGAEQAAAIQDETSPRNRLIASWSSS